MISQFKSTVQGSANLYKQFKHEKTYSVQFTQKLANVNKQNFIFLEPEKGTEFILNQYVKNCWNLPNIQITLEAIRRQTKPLSVVYNQTKRQWRGIYL